MCFGKFSRQTVLVVLLVLGLVAACGGGGGGSPPAPTPPPPPIASNVVAVTVDSGPIDESGQSVNAINSLYTTVKVCHPASSTSCTTIDHVLVDTGSTGLRLLSSVLSSSLNLSVQNGSTGLPLLSCAQFVDNTFAWGPVALADVTLGTKTAANVPIQLIGDPAYDQLSGVCQAGAGNMNTITALGAKGILGVGLFLQDCGSNCASSVGNGRYFSCATSACKKATGVAVALGKQLQNPVALFAQDNNGVLIDLPAVASAGSPAGAPALSGSMIFGVATQSNNLLSSGAKVLATDAYGNITTVLQGASMPNSFIDSGSNGLFFNSSAIAACSNANYRGFYCPSGLTVLTATLSVPGAGAATVPVSVPFAVDNAATLFANASWSVYPTLSGPNGDASSFDWGLPFFFDRRVFIGIEGQGSAVGTGPFYAF
ncbi:MAG: DUF3443 family protein [Betaproteobacteria bacterium]